MAIRIFQQPDGRYAVFSNTVDDFLIEDKTEEEVREWYLDRKRREAEENIERMLSEIDERRVSRGSTTYADAAEIAGRE